MCGLMQKLGPLRHDGVYADGTAHSSYASCAFHILNDRANPNLEDMTRHAIENVYDTPDRHATYDFHMQTSRSNPIHNGIIYANIHIVVVSNN